MRIAITQSWSIMLLLVGQMYLDGGRPSWDQVYLWTPINISLSARMSLVDVRGVPDHRHLRQMERGGVHAFLC